MHEGDYVLCGDAREYFPEKKPLGELIAFKPARGGARLKAAPVDHATIVVFTGVWQERPADPENKQNVRAGVQESGPRKVMASWMFRANKATSSRRLQLAAAATCGFLMKKQKFEKGTISRCPQLIGLVTISACVRRSVLTLGYHSCATCSTVQVTDLMRSSASALSPG